MKFYSDRKQNEIMIFTRKRMELEIILVNKVREEGKSLVFYHMKKLDLKVCICCVCKRERERTRKGIMRSD